jgi:hypothetical protein
MEKVNFIPLPTGHRGAGVSPLPAKDVSPKGRSNSPLFLTLIRGAELPPTPKGVGFRSVKMMMKKSPDFFRGFRR